VTEYELDYPVVIFIVGAVVFLVMIIKSGFDRTSVPSLIGYLILGFLLRLFNEHTGFLNAGSREIFEFLAQIGLITLLFRVGLESNLRGLMRQLRRASVVWTGNVCISGPLGFITAFYWLHFSWSASLIIATAFTATSVGITVAVWEDAGALDTPEGQLLVDVAEMDDISAVVLMALLFSIIPVFGNGSDSALLPVVSKVLGMFIVKLFAFGALCFLFSQYVEKRVTRVFRSLESPPDPMIVVVAIGFMIAAVADGLGFSLAIGAFFAGLVFSRDPDTIKMESSFIPLYDLFSPFFFIGIGMDLDPGAMTSALGISAILLLMAFFSKVIANGIPVFFLSGPGSGILIGLSMVPRAEIAMVIMQRGLKMGQWSVSEKGYAAMVVVSAATCIISPVVIKSLLKRRFGKERSQ
jgi:Kef-type K+ transport system membrane component KefB